MVGSLTRTAAVAFGLALSAGAAFADSIDGNWCHNDGRRFTIRGPEIVTPGGKRMEGHYSRHGFSYVVPKQETGEGQTIVMSLANENTVYLRYGEATAGAQETWLRCMPSISALEILRRS